MESLVDDVSKVDPIGSKLMYTLLHESFNFNPILHYHETGAAKDGKYSTLAATKS